MRVIIPAAGRASRVGGVRKELLPLSDAPGDTSLRRAVERAYALLGADRVVVVSTPELIAQHAYALAEYPIDYQIQQGGGDIWGAIRTGIMSNDAGGLILPDTVWSGTPVTLDAPIAFGVFWTEATARFSV